MDRYSPSVRKRRLGLAMRRYREACNLTAEAAGKVLGIAASTLTKMETADRTLTKPVLLLMFDRYAVPPEGQKELLDLQAQSRARGWWQDLSVQQGTYVDFEAEATQIQSFDCVLVPGLLQTEKYAAAIMSATRADVAPTQRENWKQVRVKRAELLAEPDGPMVWSVVHESALRTQVGGADVMRAQVAHVARTIEATPRLEVQLLPFGAGEFASMESSFSLLTFDDLPSLGYTETMTSGIWLERQRDINLLTYTFGKLISQAMSPADSLRWLKEYGGRTDHE